MKTALFQCALFGPLSEEQKRRDEFVYGVREPSSTSFEVLGSGGVSALIYVSARLSSRTFFLILCSSPFSV